MLSRWALVFVLPLRNFQSPRYRINTLETDRLYYKRISYFLGKKPPRVFFKNSNSNNLIKAQNSHAGEIEISPRKQVFPAILPSLTFSFHSS